MVVEARFDAGHTKSFQFLSYGFHQSISKVEA